MTERLPFAITLAPSSSLGNHTGAWRTERPVYVDGLPPCNHACPAGEQVQAWLYSAEDGSYEQAWRRLVADNPFPAVMGRICYHPCESACNRAQLDSAVGINSVERFLGDEAIARGWALPGPGAETGRRVLVVGSGPAGLSAAYHLRRLGHHVEIREATDAPGGLLRHGIPTFRLPRDVLDAEIERLLATGVTLRVGTAVRDVEQEMRAGGFDAVFLAVGAQLSHRAYVPAVQAAHVLDALSLLGGVAAGERPQLGRTVVVYGGGNTAMDVARTARRLGAHDSIVVYRRTRAQMPANDVEVSEASEESVRMSWLRTIREVGDGEVVLEQMELDDAGIPRPTGQTERLDADSVVLALGQDVDRTLFDAITDVRLDGGIVQVDHTMMTGHPGIFAGGDAVGTARSATAAIGHGRQAARAIDEWLRRAPATAVEPLTEAVAPAVVTEPVAFSALNTWYYSDAPHAVRPRLDAARRTDDFREVVGGLDAGTALYEARRCMSCGNCFGCDNCFGMCPDNAVVKDGDSLHAYRIDYDHCKGCGICAAECPCGAIRMEPEPS